MKLPSGIFTGNDAKKRQDLINSLIRYEGKIGGQLFGPLTPGSRRDFFCLDERTWVWHEEWTDTNGQHQSRTTRYIIRPTDVIKTTGDGNYRKLSDAEARHLHQAAVAYHQKIRGTYQNILSGTN